MVDYKIVGKHIKEARLRLDIKQNEAAFRAGMSTAYYSKYERGVIKPNIDRLGDICTALNLPLEAVVGGALITEGKILDNIPMSVEEFELYVKATGNRTDDRTKRIIMRLCDELSNLPI